MRLNNEYSGAYECYWQLLSLLVGYIFGSDCVRIGAKGIWLSFLRGCLHASCAHANVCKKRAKRTRAKLSNGLLCSRRRRRWFGSAYLVSVERLRVTSFGRYDRFAFAFSILRRLLRRASSKKAKAERKTMIIASRRKRLSSSSSLACKLHKTNQLPS